jgi:hypothetical protein
VSRDRWGNPRENRRDNKTRGTATSGKTPVPRSRDRDRDRDEPAESPADVPFYRKVIAHNRGEDPGGFGPNWSNVDLDRLPGWRIPKEAPKERWLYEPLSYVSLVLRDPSAEWVLLKPKVSEQILETHRLDAQGAEPVTLR